MVHWRQISICRLVEEKDERLNNRSFVSDSCNFRVLLEDDMWQWLKGWDRGENMWVMFQDILTEQNHKISSKFTVSAANLKQCSGMDCRTTVEQTVWDWKTGRQTDWSHNKGHGKVFFIFSLHDTCRVRVPLWPF